MGEKYLCNNCRYFWKSRKNYGYPAYCPRCSSKNISFDTFGTIYKSSIIGILTTGFFIYSLIQQDEGIKVFGNIAIFFGIPLLVLSLITYLDGKRKNKLMKN